jgi:nucleotide-binding universal stress UspA family protein
MPTNNHLGQVFRTRLRPEPSARPRSGTGNAPPSAPPEGPRRILAVIDPKQPASAALDRAVRLAQAHDAELMIAAVLGTPVDETVFVDDYPDHCETPDDICAFERIRLHEHAERVRTAVRSCGVHLIVGVPHYAVLQFAQSWGADLVVKQAACAPDFAASPWLRYDDTDRALLKRFPHPVLVERPGDGAPDGPALAVVQPGRTPARFDSSAAVVAHRHLLERAGTPVHLLDLNRAVGGRRQPGAVPCDRWPGPPAEDAAKVPASRRAALANALRDNIGMNGVIHAIGDAADATGAGLVVVPVAPVRGLWRLVGSDVAERILAWTDYSILGVKRSDFRCPIGALEAR